MYIEVLIVLDNNIYFPELVPGRLVRKSYPYSRTGEIVDIIKNNYKLIRSEDYKDNEKEKYEGGFYKFSGDDYSCFTFNPYTRTNTTYAIEKVDTSRPWTIVKTTIGERIKYFEKEDRFKIMDEDINYGEAI